MASFLVSTSKGTQVKKLVLAKIAPMGMTAKFAQGVIDRCLIAARAENLLMNIAVVDLSGRLKAFIRDDGAWLGSVDIAQAKAFTALGFSGNQDKQGPLSTEDLNKEAFNKGSLLGITDTNRRDGVVAFGGGIPLYDDQDLIGAVGVSGSTVENDIKVAQAALGE